MVQLNLESLDDIDLDRIRNLATTLKEECEGEQHYRTNHLNSSEED